MSEQQQQSTQSTSNDIRTKPIGYGGSLRAESLERQHNKNDEWPRFLSHSSPVKGYRRFSHQESTDSFGSAENQKLNVSERIYDGNNRQTRSLDNIIENPGVTEPLNKNNRWFEFHDIDSNHLIFVNDSGVGGLNGNQQHHSVNESDGFGDVVVPNSVLPGTPMIDSISDISKSFESGGGFSIYNERRSSINGSYDSRTGLINKFSETEEFERKVSYKKQKRLSEHKEMDDKKRDSGSDDTMSSNGERRMSKQDAELIEDPESLMFRDGRRKIDMVLCYEEESNGVETELDADKRERRRVFQDNLRSEGLDIEVEDKNQSFDEKTFFVKIHLPWKIESRYAEVMNLKLPVKRFITISVKAWENEKQIVKQNDALHKLYSFIKKSWINFRNYTEYDQNLIEKEPSFYGATAGGKPEEQFIVKDRCTTYNSAQRSLMVMQILLRAKYDESEKVGIRRLLNDHTYLACFPLHEGRYDRSHKSGSTYDRRLLYLEWARPLKTWYKKQPLCTVRKYFGDKIGLYFCWLGFYTQSLVFPAIVGLICFIYGISSMNSDDNIPSKEMCDESGVGNITLCPLCDKACSYQKLHDSCLFAQITYLFDNPSTVFFAIFMSFWATTFLELWKRKQSVIVWEWDMHNLENDEEARPEFESSIKTFRTNPVTREKEAFMPYWQRFFRFVASGSAVLFMISIVMGAVLGTIIYRISLVSVIYGGFSGYFIKTHAKLVTSMTAALINLIIIMILTKIYHKLAIHLTNMENPRTQTEYEDSYTFKIFVFEFMNYYSSLIYIAFFKGRFYDYPGDDVQRKSEFLRLKGDICDPAGCLSELCIQLSIIMIGKQFWNNFMEYLYPTFYNFWRQRKHKKDTKDDLHLHMTWEQDYHLQDPGRLALFDEYLEMIIQYGFVTLFVAAFPLAPLFALINNILEIRLDAYKLVSQARRPLGERVEDIGAWYGILKIITYVAVVSNAFVIAYTSDFIPRMVYKVGYSKNHNLVGYIDHSLSVFNTSDYKEEWGGKGENDPDTCQYRGYRLSYNTTDPYGLSPHYWHIFAARLAFVVVFEHIVFVITAIMQFLIPDIPVELKTQIQREQLLAKEAKYQNGLNRARENEYEDLLSAIRDNNSAKPGPTPARSHRSNWGSQKFSKLAYLNANEVNSKRSRLSLESTVWEIT